ncbi:hypothetical protein [uncultured Brachyspira sp.]|uniref:hypothetical protein n=1 Tax=uncultured Brachyspira sp. TaxID=221953 RepID=UPI0026384888|nr:hypothetical protein [uncultured Brachyspira sp.]
MQILISIIINIIILAVALPLFYIYIVSKARERLEKETMSKAREEIESLVKEFNNIALSRISILEDSIVRANRLIKELNGFQSKKISNTEITEKPEAITPEDNIEHNISEGKLYTNENKKLDIRVEDNNIENNIKDNIKPDEKIEKNSIDNNNKTKIKTQKSSNIDTAVKAIDDEAKKEVIEKLRSKLDKTIKTNMAIYDKPIEDKTIALINEPLENSIKSYNKNDDIIKLYKEGLSKEEIAKKLNCSITEIDIVIDLNID